MEALATRPAEDFASSRRLYELAKRRSWNVSTDIEWPLDSSLPEWPFPETKSCFSGYPRHDCLPASERQRIAWRQHVLEVSELYHGEEAAMIACSLLLRDMPQGESRHFLCSQLFDEARHSEFFQRYLQQLGTAPVPIGRRLGTLLARCRDEDCDMETRLLICQLVVESLALGRFSDLMQSSQVPVLRQALQRIRQDEARHVSFGIRHLHHILRDRTDEERDDLGCFVLRTVFDLIADTGPLQDLVREYSWPATELRGHLRRQMVLRARGSLVLPSLLRSLRQLDLLGPRGRCLLQLRGLAVPGESAL